MKSQSKSTYFYRLSIFNIDNLFIMKVAHYCRAATLVNVNAKQINLCERVI